MGGLKGFSCAQGEAGRPGARGGSKPITELRLHGAACRTPNGHGAWSRGAWPIPCVRVCIDPYAHVKLSTLEDSEHSSAIMDGCEALLPTRQLFTHGLLSRLASLQLLLLGHRTLRTQACQPMSARPSEAKRGRVQMSAAQVTSSSSSSSSFLPLAFLFTTAFWALLEPPPAPVGCETSAESRPSVSGGQKHGIRRQRLPSSRAQGAKSNYIPHQGRHPGCAQRSAARGR